MVTEHCIIKDNLYINMWYVMWYRNTDLHLDSKNSINQVIYSRNESEGDFMLKSYV